MDKIATLGPKGTYSELATIKYIASQHQSFQIAHFGSIKKAFSSIGKDNDCNFGVIPIENLSKGFVSLVLDLLAETNLRIISEVILPIKFAFVSQASDLTEVDKLYVQFVAKSQCSEFIGSMDEPDIVITESNIQSLDLVVKNGGHSAAIVPAGSYDPSQFNTEITNVTDYENNQTRFIVLTNSSQPYAPSSANSKTSIVVLDDNDHPGVLSEILTSFSNRNINLLSIISRPTRKVFGKYNFFIDLQGHICDATLSDAISEIKQKYKVKVLGSYTAAKTL